MRPSDTSPEAWQVQIEIMRRKGPLERLLMACRMSEDLHAWELRRNSGKPVVEQIRECPENLPLG